MRDMWQLTVRPVVDMVEDKDEDEEPRSQDERTVVEANMGGSRQAGSVIRPNCQRISN